MTNERLMISYTLLHNPPGHPSVNAGRISGDDTGIGKIQTLEKSGTKAEEEPTLIETDYCRAGYERITQGSSKAEVKASFKFEANN